MPAKWVLACVAVEQGSCWIEQVCDLVTGEILRPNRFGLNPAVSHRRNARSSSGPRLRRGTRSPGRRTGLFQGGMDNSGKGGVGFCRRVMMGNPVNQV
jgi:hypothetical protein